MVYNVEHVYNKIHEALMIFDSILITSQPIQSVFSSDFIYEALRNNTPSFDLLRRYFNFNPIFAFKITRDTEPSLEEVSSMLTNIPVYEGASLFIVPYNANKPLIRFEGSYNAWCYLHEVVNISCEYEEVTFENILSSLDKSLEEICIQDATLSHALSNALQSEDALEAYINTQPTQGDFTQVILDSFYYRGCNITPGEVSLKTYNSLLAKIPDTSKQVQVDNIVKDLINHSTSCCPIVDSLPDSKFHQLIYLTEEQEALLKGDHLLGAVIDTLSYLYTQFNQFPFLLVQHDDPIKFYHLTYESCKNSILQNGLAPSQAGDLGVGIYAVLGDTKGVDNLYDLACNDLYNMKEGNIQDSLVIIQGTYDGPYLQCIFDCSHESNIILPTCARCDDLHTVTLEDVFGTRIKEYTESLDAPKSCKW